MDDALITSPATAATDALTTATTPPSGPRRSKPAALVVLSHLGWDFVWQRPQHLMTQAAQDRRVLFVETPSFEHGIEPHLRTTESHGVTVCRPAIPWGHSPEDSQRMTAEVLARFVADEDIRTYDLWVYTPMELPVAQLLEPRLTVYDCMDELSQFRFAPPELREREAELLARADVVFTGGHRLHEAKREVHDFAHPFPSSVDVAHFRQARDIEHDPEDQASLRRPRLGWAGVIDERMDYELVGELARRRPEWELVMIGPVVKVDPATLPQAPNLHWMGGRTYDELPSYLAHWDVALMPFARNEATEFISPTKTPEYLAAGLPVVSTAIRDVVRPWGEEGLVQIANTPAEFEAACARALEAAGTPADAQRHEAVERRLGQMSWARTWRGMDDLLAEALLRRS